MNNLTGSRSRATDDILFRLRQGVFRLVKRRRDRVTQYIDVDHLACALIDDDDSSTATSVLLVAT
ncbi:Clp protease N-terminal domain-containing protein [Exiguobacterium sp. B2(2022)]|uniref:Clp protease N-terminal domain-containing protein n=1 Tax=Exiguobacterium sp. B2(2022) TaxID=2992755 RepID=UPI00406CFAC3